MLLVSVQPGLYSTDTEGEKTSVPGTEPPLSSPPKGHYNRTHQYRGFLGPLGPCNYIQTNPSPSAESCSRFLHKDLRRGYKSPLLFSTMSSNPLQIRIIITPFICEYFAIWKSLTLYFNNSELAWWPHFADEKSEAQGWRLRDVQSWLESSHLGTGILSIHDISPTVVSEARLTPLSSPNPFSWLYSI